jgi:hypothetical protein
LRVGFMIIYGMHLPHHTHTEEALPWLQKRISS